MSHSRRKNSRGSVTEHKFVNDIGSTSPDEDYTQLVVGVNVRRSTRVFCSLTIVKALPDEWLAESGRDRIVWNLNPAPECFAWLGNAELGHITSLATYSGAGSISYSRFSIS